jgi:hypothetical protein
MTSEVPVVVSVPVVADVEPVPFVEPSSLRAAFTGVGNANNNVSNIKRI